MTIGCKTRSERRKMLFLQPEVDAGDKQRHHAVNRGKTHEKRMIIGRDGNRKRRGEINEQKERNDKDRYSERDREIKRESEKRKESKNE